MNVQNDANPSMMLVTIGDRRYLIPVADVECALFLRRAAISAVPFDAGGKIRGIFSYKGAVVAIMRCPELCPLSDDNGEENLTAVILRRQGARFALLVDSAQAIVRDSADADIPVLTAQALYQGNAHEGD